MNLAVKYRPTSLDDMVGQEHLLARSAPFRILVEKKRLPHIFLYGPPGCGKTTLARIIADMQHCPYHEFNAASIKVDDLRKVFAKYSGSGKKPLIFIDEVHRLSKNQQEVLLPFMEENSILAVGASTRNPYYSMTAAIRSRSHLFGLRAIGHSAMSAFLKKVLSAESIEIETKEAEEYLVRSSSGDLRAMLNLLESAASVAFPVTLESMKAIRSHAIQSGSAESDSHYDLISAMIKSIRGSDIDAGLYYLARLIEGGEPPEFLARRLAILASEDIGNANPNALNIAASTMTIVERIGYPEARIALAQLVIYLASSPKSDSAYRAIDAARQAVSDGRIYPVPEHLKTRSSNYKNPHNFGGWTEQVYMPEHKRFYSSSKVGFEKRLDEWSAKIRGEAPGTE